MSLRIPFGTLVSIRRLILRQYRSHMLISFPSLGDREGICELRSLIHLLNCCAPLHCSLDEKRYCIEASAERLDQNRILVLSLLFVVVFLIDIGQGRFTRVLCERVYGNFL